MVEYYLTEKLCLAIVTLSVTAGLKGRQLPRALGLKGPPRLQKRGPQFLKYKFST